jgi:drug/metabolite transporter (DMT)-like permease
MSDHPSPTAEDPHGAAVRTGGRALPRRRPPPRLTAVVVLSLATAIWGASFVVTKGLVDDHDPLSVLVLRFAIGTVALWALRPGAVRALSRTDRWRAGVIGVLLGAAQVPHYFGVRETSASAAAFLIGTYVVATPVFDRLLHGVRTTRAAVGGTVIALGGLAVVASGGTVSGIGLMLCLGAAVLYALQITTVGAWTPASNIWGFTTVTVAAITVVVAVPAAARGLELPASPPDWLRLMYLALVAGVAAVAMQAWAQRRIAATHAAVILVMEPLWAAGLAVLFTTEDVSAQLLVGGAVLFVANLVVAAGSGRGPQTPDASRLPH